MKTNFKVSEEAFRLCLGEYMRNKSYPEQLAELMLIFENNDGRYYNSFMQSRRMKAHGAAFYAVILAVKPFMQAGYYIDNQHVKKLIKEVSGLDYKEYLAPLAKEIEQAREVALREV